MSDAFESQSREELIAQLRQMKEQQQNSKPTQEVKNGNNNNESDEDLTMKVDGGDDVDVETNENVDSSNHNTGRAPPLEPVKMQSPCKEVKDIFTKENEHMQEAALKKCDYVVGKGLTNLTQEQKDEFTGGDERFLKFAQWTKSNLNCDPECENMIAVHPRNMYQFTDFDADVTIPSMNPQQLKTTIADFREQIQRLEIDICNEIAQLELQKTKQETETTEKTEESKTESENVKKDCDDTVPYYSNEDIWHCPRWCVPCRTDIREFDFAKLASEQLRLGGRLFDVIMTDPPWQLATSNPTRGVALGYSQLQDNIIESLPIPTLQTDGLIFIWVINAKYRLALKLLEAWGYRMIQDVAWVKSTVNRRVANGHGFYLQHAKETCLVGLKGKIENIPTLQAGVCSDVIFSDRRGQSQKPEEIYEYVERLVPSGYYLEIFARRNNLRDGWVSIGNEL